MIPANWIAHHRLTDGTPVGYLAPASERDAESFSPMSLIGETLGEPQDLAEAGAVLDMRGIEMLGEPRWMRLPEPLPDAFDAVDALSPDAPWPWRPVVIVDWSATEYRIRLAHPSPGDASVPLVFPTPAAPALRRTTPDGIEERRINH
ncbi:hypothetical protein [Leifsonia poae]|uniref:hypothetical protein n=1 Tax=Leifsonia poae TaxID=110933 RepID=UPI001CBFA9EA|nr:hypothetical protein [Leifsonia poae]